MADSSVWIAVAPGQDRRAIQDEIAGANEPTTEGAPDHDDQERLVLAHVWKGGGICKTPSSNSIGQRGTLI
jgi:hypothetical protein